MVSHTLFATGGKGTKMKRFPLGMQSFRSLIESDYVLGRR